MKESITLTRKEAEDLIGIFEQRIMDKEQLGSIMAEKKITEFAKTEDEEQAITLLRDKLAGRLE